MKALALFLALAANGIGPSQDLSADLPVTSVP